MRRIFTIILLTSLMAVFGLAPTRQTQNAVRAVTAVNKNYAVIVQMAAGASINPIKTEYSLTTLSYSSSDNRYLLAPPAGTNLELLSSAIATESGVLNAEVNAEMDSPFISHGQPQNFSGSAPVTLGTSSTPYNSQTLTTFFQLSSVYAHSQGLNVKVAVIDTGIDLLHPKFSGRIATGGNDFLDNDLTPNDECCGTSYGHGTFIAGLVLLIAPQAKILPIRVMNPTGIGCAFDVAAGIRHAAVSGAKVINLSLGTDTKLPAIVKDALTFAKNSGCVIVAAVGNKNDGTGKMYPASDTYVLGVAATDFNKKKASFSNYGSSVDLDAPGVDLISTYPGGLYARWSGTSFSTPLVSAQAALLYALAPPSASDVIGDIKGTAIKIDTQALNPGYGGKLGSGLISPLNSLVY